MPIEHTGQVVRASPGRGFAPLWVYFFGWFAVAIAQRWLLPPHEHSTLANLAVFAAGALLVAVVLTVAERRRRRA